jgi:hypothetical protein
VVIPVQPAGEPLGSNAITNTRLERDLQVADWIMDRPAVAFLGWMEPGWELGNALPIRVKNAIDKGLANPRIGALTTERFLRMSAHEFAQIRGIGPALAAGAVQAIEAWVTAGLKDGTITTGAPGDLDPDATGAPERVWEEISEALVESHRSYAYEVTGPWGVDGADSAEDAIAEAVKARAEHRSVYGRDERYRTIQARRTLTVYFSDDSFYEAAPETLPVPEPPLTEE